MIEYCTGDIFESGAEALVNPVNCKGVMGAGLAKQFKARFPRSHRTYVGLCQAGEVRPGVAYWGRESAEPGPEIVQFPTKDDWREPSKMEWIEQGLESLVSGMKQAGHKSIAIPALGCGLGGLNWDDVRPKIEAAFADLPDVRVMLYPPLPSPLPCGSGVAH